MTAHNTAEPMLLMAEDDEDMVTLLRFILEREGYQVVHAADGRQATTLIDTMVPPALSYWTSCCRI